MPYGRTISDNEGGLPGAVIFESDASGKPIANAKIFTADVNGFVLIDTNNVDQFYTIQYTGYKPLTDTLRNLPPVINLMTSGTLPQIEVTAKRSYYLLGTLLALILIFRAKK